MPSGTKDILHDLRTMIGELEQKQPVTQPPTPADVLRLIDDIYDDLPRPQKSALQPLNVFVIRNAASIFRWSTADDMSVGLDWRTDAVGRYSTADIQTGINQEFPNTDETFVLLVSQVTQSLYEASGRQYDLGSVAVYATKFVHEVFPQLPEPFQPDQNPTE